MGKDQDLVQAVKEQDAVAVEKILAKNRNSKKIIGSVKRLNINQQDGDGMSVLHHAVLLGNVDIIQALLDHGSLVDMKDAKGMRPLHYGAWQGHDRPVELLLGRGSSVNQASTADGTSPLHLACEHGHLDVVRKLLKSGADVTVANNQNKTPLDLACEFGRTRVVELLLESEPCRHLLQDTSDDMADNSRTTCLHLAARNGHVDIIRLLLRGGIDINRQTLQGTSLHEAAKYGKTDVVRLLLSCGIDVTRLNSYEQTALEIVNKFTATRAAKELKHMLHDASSGIRIPAVSTPEPPTCHATAAAAAREPNHLAAPQSTEPTNAPLVVGIFRGGHRNGLESHLAALSGGSSSSFAKTGHTKSSDLNSSKTTTTTTTTGNQLKPFPWNRSSPQPSPVDHVVHITGSGRGDDGFLPPPSPLAKVKVFSSQDAGIASHGSSFRSSGPQKSSSSVPSVGRQSPSSWNGLHQHHHHLTSCPDPTAEASHRMSSGSNSSGGCSSSSTSSTPSHQTTASRQNRLSGQSCESGVSSSRQSYHSSSGSSQGSLDHLEESGYSSTVNVNELIQQGLSDTDVLHTWLSSLQLEELTSLFVDAGYDMPTISRMTPEDLTAIGITKPSIRKKLKSEISKLTINDGIPDARPKDLSEWLNTLHLDGYRHTLVQQGYGTLDTVTDLTWEDLEEIGIKKLGHQKKIMLAIDRLTRINSTLHRLSASCSSSSGQSSSAETLNHPESFAFAGKFVPGNPGSASSASAQPRVTPYEMPCPKSWKLRANGSGGVTVERNDRPGVMQCPAGLVEIHASPNRQSPSLLQVSNMGSINHNTYPALPETSNESDVRTRPNARSTPPLLDGDATPTNERKNSDRNQRTIKFGSKVKGASREEPLNFYQVEPHIARENGFSSYSTLPRKFSGKRKMAGFDSSFGSDEQYSGGFNGNTHDVSAMKESNSRDLGHFPSVIEGGETASNKRKKEPPPLPKRINSFKSDSKSLYGMSRDNIPHHLESDGKGYPPLTAGVFPDSTSKASADLRLVASNNSRVAAGAAVSSQNTIRTSVNLSPANNSLRSNQTTASDVSCNIANAGAVDWQDGRMNECSGDDSSDSGLESRHSASSVSLESSGSGGTVESNTLPFANENVGTIKQRNPSAKPSILTTADGEPGKLNASLFENGSSTIRRNSRASTERMDNAEVPVSQFMLVNGEIISEIATSNGNLPYGVSSDNVFNDIDGMLSGLTQELDEMLKLHG